MYPQRELTRLSAYKVALQRDIARHRDQCVKAAGRVAKPLDLLDSMLALWRRVLPLAPLAALPLGMLIQRTSFPGLKIIRPLLRWGPLVFTAIRSIRSIGTTVSELSKNTSAR